MLAAFSLPAIAGRKCQHPVCDHILAPQVRVLQRNQTAILHQLAPVVHRALVADHRHRRHQVEHALQQPPR